MHKSIEDLIAELSGLRSQVTELDEEFAGRSMTPEARETWNELNTQIDDNNALVEELRARTARLEQVAAEPDHIEDERSIPQVRRPGAVRNEDIYDLSSIRSNMFDTTTGSNELRDRALRSIDASVFAGNVEDCRSHVAGLLDSHTSEVGKLILTTGSPQYRSAFQKTLSGQPLNGDEVRAMSLTNASGGFAVPYTLDPTVIPTSNKQVNPLREVAKKVQITGDEWRGVTAGAVVASYSAEATETTDNSPTLGQPVISTEKAQCFIPYSIEIGMDWPSFVSEMGALIVEGKDDLEATKLLSGSGTNEPFGLLTGATTTTTAAGTASFALADLYTLEGALPSRHRARASFLANRSIYSRVRQFDTAGGAALWLTMAQATGGGASPGNITANLMGYPAYEASGMDSTLTTGNKIAVIGNFDRFVLVDRIGLTVETVSHLVGTNHRPTGQRGIYAYWRNGSKVIDANAFRVLVTG